MDMQKALAGHRRIVGDYAAAVDTLNVLRAVQPEQDLFVTIGPLPDCIAVPPDIAHRLVADEIRRTEARMQELATRLRDSAAALAPDPARA